MALAVKKLTPRQVVLKIRTEFFGENTTYGPLRGWLPDEDDKAKVIAYRRAVKSIRGASKAWKTRRLFLEANGHPSEHRQVVCEHCLRRRPVVLVQPGIISRHENGDWVCYSCDPDVAGEYLTRIGLEELVLEESS